MKRLLAVFVLGSVIGWSWLSTFHHHRAQQESGCQTCVLSHQSIAISVARLILPSVGLIQGQMPSSSVILIACPAHSFSSERSPPVDLLV